MGKQRINADRPLTNLEIQRRHEDKISSIDEALDAALAAIDWKRRRNAERSFLSWIDTYCVGLMIEDAPSAKMREALSEMDAAL